MIKLRCIVALTNQREIDVEAEPGIHPGDLKALIFAAAKEQFGAYDEVRIVSMEENAGDNPAPLRVSVKWVRASAVAERHPDLFPASVTLSRYQLYAALAQQGYVWDKLIMEWQRKEAPNVPTR